MCDWLYLNTDIEIYPPPAHGGDIFDNGSSVLFSPAGYNYICAFLRESLRASLPDTGRAAGNKDCFSVKVIHKYSPLQFVQLVK